MDESRQKEFREKALPLLNELYGVALRMTRNPQTAEDLVSESYAKAWKALDQFQPGTNIRAWVYKIMTNTYINAFRKTHREPEKVSLDAYDRIEDFHFFNKIAAQSPQTPAPDPFSSVVNKMTKEDFQKALGKLPDEYRAAVILFDVERLSYQEVADALEIPLGTVRSRLARGRRMLQVALAKHAAELGLVKNTGGPVKRWVRQLSTLFAKRAQEPAGKNS